MHMVGASHAWWFALGEYGYRDIVWEEGSEDVYFEDHCMEDGAFYVRWAPCYFQVFEHQLIESYQKLSKWLIQFFLFVEGKLVVVNSCTINREWSFFLWFLSLHPELFQLVETGSLRSMAHHFRLFYVQTAFHRLFFFGDRFQLLLLLFGQII